MENGFASRFDLQDLVQLLNDKRFAMIVLKVLPAFVDNSTGMDCNWRSKIVRTNQIFEHVIRMELSSSDFVIAWLDMLSHLELSKENRLILKRVLSVKQKSFSLKERAVLLRTLLAIIPSKQDITFQSNISFILQTTPFSIMEPLLPSFPSKPLPLVLIEELTYKPFTPDSLLYTLYFACFDMSSSLLSTLKSRIQHGHVTHSLFEQAIARSSSMVSHLLQCFLLVASWEIERAFPSLEAWAVMQSIGFWMNWFESVCSLCRRNRSEFQTELMQLAENREVESHLRVLSLSLLNHCRNEVSESVAHSLRNHFHILPRSTIAWYCYLLRDYKGDVQWVQEVDDFTSLSLISAMNLPLQEWITLRSSHSQDLDVISERIRMGVTCAPHWCCSFDAVGNEFMKQITNKTSESEKLEIFERMRIIVSSCCSNKQYDGSEVYCILFETVCIGDSIQSGNIENLEELEKRYYSRFDLLIPWMHKKGYKWIQLIEFLSYKSICAMPSPLKWKCMCYSEFYWKEEEILQTIEKMSVQPSDLYNNCMLFRFCNRVGKLPYPSSIDLSSDDPSMLLLLLQLHSSDSDILSVLPQYAWIDVNPLVIPLSIRGFARLIDVPDAVLTLLSLLKEPKSFDAFLTRSFPTVNAKEETFPLPSEKRRKANFKSMMKHIEQLAAFEASNRESVSLEFPFLTSSNEYHFGLTCLDVCAARCEELLSWRQYTPWIQEMIQLMQSFNVTNMIKKKKKAQADAVVIERIVQVFVTFLNGILTDAREGEDWSELVKQIRNQGLVSKELKDILECVESTFHFNW